MVLELHVYGPAFGLPSIDADCLATIVYLQQCLPAESWSLIASDSPDRTPFQQLPALRDQNTWVAGFEPIIQYLRDTSGGQWYLDQDLNERQQADRQALYSYTQSRGQPLLDLSLYVSSDNYNNCTRSAWGEILSWPQSWTIPHRLRQKAKKRSEHLGLNALDVDSAQEKDKQNEGLTAHIPKSLRKPKQTVNGLLGGSVRNTKFRLDAVTADFLEPLQLTLDNKEWLIGHDMGSIDCLVIAYLSLMQIPELPQSWLREALSGKYNVLGRWATKQTTRAFGPPIDAFKTTRGDSAGSTLPWVAPESRSWYSTISTITESIVSSIPFLRAGHEQTEIEIVKDTGGDKYKHKQLAYIKLRNKQIFYSQIVTGCIGAASAYAWLVHLGMLGLPSRRAQPSRRNFGEAGTLLGLR